MSIDMKVLGALILALSVGVLLAVEISKRVYASKLAFLYKQGEVDEYLNVLAKPLVRLAFPAWNRAFMYMNGLIVKEDHNALDTLIPKMLNMKQNGQQYRELIGRVFNYYVEQGNKVAAKSLLEKIESTESSEKFKQARMVYEIYLEKSYAYIESLEGCLSEFSGVNYGFIELLLAVQYENKGDARRAEHYFKKSQVDIGGAITAPFLSVVGEE